jgi:hypothetical protein
MASDSALEESTIGLVQCNLLQPGCSAAAPQLPLSCRCGVVGCGLGVVGGGAKEVRAARYSLLLPLLLLLLLLAAG